MFDQNPGQNHIPFSAGTEAQEARRSALLHGCPATTTAEHVRQRFPNAVYGRASPSPVRQPQPAVEGVGPRACKKVRPPMLSYFSFLYIIYIIYNLFRLFFDNSDKLVRCAYGGDLEWRKLACVWECVTFFVDY